ncbi:MAG: hypothetical protein U5R06_13950 [candidate division KSB1 bacterium]|nr:hypothetical protein [candidate division KSB1 bacterium]
MKPARGENPNPFYWIPEIKKPLISDAAELNAVDIEPTFMYDLSTQAGGVYTLRTF